MPYGDLAKQAVQRFATYEDMDRHECTIEEREEYEPYVDMGAVIYSGVDYHQILKEAEKEADIIIWDGGNNDLPFYRPDLHITVVDPHRPGHELRYHPGETNVRMADVIVINKVDTADNKNVVEVQQNVRSLNPKAILVRAASPVLSRIRGDPRQERPGYRGRTDADARRMRYGAGYVAANYFDAARLSISPTP